MSDTLVVVHFIVRKLISEYIIKSLKIYQSFLINVC